MRRRRRRRKRRMRRRRRKQEKGENEEEEMGEEEKTRKKRKTTRKKKEAEEEKKKKNSVFLLLPSGKAHLDFTGPERRVVLLLHKPRLMSPSLWYRVLYRARYRAPRSCAAILREVAVRSLRKARHCDSKLQNVPRCINTLPPG